MKWHWLYAKILAVVYKLSPGIDQDIDYLANFVNVNKIDIVWFGFGNISFELMKGLRAKLPQVKLVCDTDAVWSRFLLRELDVATDLQARGVIEEKGFRKQIEENEWQEFVDITTAVSEVDACYYRSISKTPDNIKIFSNVVDLEGYLQIPNQANSLICPNIYLAGSFWPGSPMEHASRWFIDKVFPIILGVNPYLHLYIVGKNSDSILADVRNPNITVTGKVDSVLPYLCYASVAIVPLFFESGTRFKILEAGAVGIPIVSTTLGAEGLPVQHGEHLLIADSPEDFAAAINQVISSSNLSKKLSDNCKKLILEKFSVQSLASEAQQIVDYLNHGYGDR
jgi:glycosyltransferase involved in cell wall biosynthesis